MERPHAIEVISLLDSQIYTSDGILDKSCWWRLCKSGKVLLHEDKKDQQEAISH